MSKTFGELHECRKQDVRVNWRRKQLEYFNACIEKIVENRAPERKCYFKMINGGIIDQSHIIGKGHNFQVNVQQKTFTCTMIRSLIAIAKHQFLKVKQIKCIS